MVISNTSAISDVMERSGAPLPGGGEFYSAGGPGFASPTLERELEGPPDWGGQPPMYNERNIPIYEGGQLVGARAKGAPGAVMENGMYLDPVSMENYANAARQADIYSKIKMRLDDPSNDLLEELDRQWEVEYEALRNNLVNQENTLLDRAKVEGWDEKRTGFLRDSLYNQFAQDDMALKRKYSETQQEWDFIDKEVARRVKSYELNPNNNEAEQVARNLKMGKLRYSFPGRVRSEMDRAVALAGADAAIAAGMDPGEADFMFNVPASVRNRAGQGTDKGAKLKKLNELRGQGIPIRQAVLLSGLTSSDLSVLGIAEGDLDADNEEYLNKMLGPPTGGGAQTAPATGARVKIKSPDGKVGTVPAEQLQDALAQGYTEVK